MSRLGAPSFSFRLFIGSSLLAALALAGAVGCSEDSVTAAGAAGQPGAAGAGGQPSAGTGGAVSAGAAGASAGGGAGKASGGAAGAAAGGSAGAETGGSAGATDGGAAGSPGPERGVGKIEGTEGFIAAPAQCGQAPYTILDSDQLGEVVDYSGAKPFSKDLLALLIEQQGITLPRPLQYDATVSVLRYTTQDRGKLIEATAAIARPSNVPADAPALPVLALLHGTSGFRDGCGASKALEYQGLAAAFASMGFFVIIPDYLGLKANGEPTGFPHPYLGGIPTAIASLDAVRTVFRLPDDLIEGAAKPSRDLVIVGGSQGGHAALWVDRLAPYYASEFDLRGVVATVPPADLVTESTLALSTVRSSTANSIAVMSTLPAWYGAEGKIGEWLKEPIATQAPAILAASCEPTDEQKKVIEGYETLDEVFQPALLDAAKAGTLAGIETLGCIVSENGLTSTSLARKNPPTDGYGILWVLAEKDTLVDTPTERASFETLCNAGMPMTFLECAGASHTQGTTWALPEITTFLFDRLDGKAFTPACAATEPVRCLGTPADK